MYNPEMTFDQVSTSVPYGVLDEILDEIRPQAVQSDFETESKRLGQLRVQSETQTQYDLITALKEKADALAETA